MRRIAIIGTRLCPPAISLMSSPSLAQQFARFGDRSGAHVVERGCFQIARDSLRSKERREAHQGCRSCTRRRRSADGCVVALLWHESSKRNSHDRRRRGYPDLHEHLDALRARGLLLTIDEPIDKDAELHPLVRWQFVGGLEEPERKAFLFTNIIDGRGRKYCDARRGRRDRREPRDLQHRHGRAGRGDPGEVGPTRSRNPMRPRVVTEGGVPRRRDRPARRCRARATGSTRCRSRSRRRASTARPR